MSKEDSYSETSNGSVAFDILSIVAFDILNAHEYGATDSWEWVGTLVKKSDGVFSFELYQILSTEGGEDGPNCHSLDQFTSGDELFEFIQGAWREETFEGLAEDQWQEVVHALDYADTSLAAEVAAAIKAEFHEEAEPQKPSTAEMLAKSAIWERTKFGGGGAQWAAIAERLRAGVAIQFYVDHYLKTHGKLPHGEHSVRVSLGALEDGADCRPPRQATQSAVFPNELRRTARRKLLYLHDATDLQDLRVPPGNRLEPLKGNLKGFHSIGINDQWRLVFRWSGGQSQDVQILHYHR